MHYRLEKLRAPRISTYLTGLMLVTAATIAWSTAGLFTRIIDLDSGTLLLWRGIFGALALGFLCVIMERGNTLDQFRSLGIAGWAYAAVSGIGMVCFITALKFTTVAHVSIIYATVPLVTAAIAWLALKEVPGKDAIHASLIAIGGVCLMMGLTSEGHWIGDALALGMTLCLAVMMIISRACSNVPILPAACLSAILSAVLVLPFSSPLSVQPDQWLWLLLFGVVNSALGLALFIIGSKMLPAIETALITALDAPLAPIWVWLLFSETPATATIAGGIIVFYAVAKYLKHQMARNQTG